jgi:NAD(P)-dependent dehydrogenase (short-subunit alcohol dehydrogenase family)
MATAPDAETDRGVPPELLAGRVVLVTGGAHGLGRDLVLGLADAGAAVAVVDRTGTAAVVDAITSAGRPAVGVDGPFETRDDASAVFAVAVAALGPLDAVIHASVDPGALVAAPIVATDDTEWDLRCEAPLRAALACAQAAFDRLGDRGGRLLFVTPTVSLTGAAELIPYTTALEGIRALAKSAARQWGTHRITVNCVAPPLELLAADGRAAPEPMIGEPALGREPDGRIDVAGVVAWLAGPDAACVTGMTVVVDGGIVMAP